MLFSIIVPIYRVERYLAQCVDSILNQTFREFELILVDDGSPDACGGICDDYAAADPRVRVIHKENGGVVSARQAGAEASSGDYILCVDGDDWISPRYCETFAAAIGNCRPDIAICGAYWAYGDRLVGHPCPEEPGRYDRARIEEVLFPQLIESRSGAYFSPSIWGKAFRRELYVPEHTALDPRIRIGEDQACVKPCIGHADSLYILSDCLYFYRQNESSMTKNGSVFDLQGPMRIAEHFESRMDLSESDFRAQVDRHFVHDLFNAAASQFNDRQRSVRQIRRELREYLLRPEVRKKIRGCRYSPGYWKGNLSRFALKHRLLGLLQAYNRVTH